MSTGSLVGCLIADLPETGHRQSPSRIVAGINVFPSVPGKSDSTTARRRHGEDKPRVHACPLLSQTCPTLQSKENDHEPPTHAYETGESPTRVVAGRGSGNGAGQGIRTILPPSPPASMRVWTSR